MKCPISKKECSNFKCYHITNINKDSVEVFDLCKNCFFDFDKIENKKESFENKICECGLSLEKYIETGLFGCHLCYSTFQGLVINKSNENFKNNIGKISEQKKEVFEINFKDFLLKLENKLSFFVKKESYEEAHRLKFVIMGLKTLIDQFEKHANNSQQQKLIQEEIKKLILKESQN